MSLQENPVVLLKNLKERAMGFFFNFWKRLKKNEFSLGKKRSTLTVAVELSQSHLLVLAVEKKGEKLEICHFRLEPRPADKEGISAQLRAIFKEEGLEPRGVRTALKISGIVIRILGFPQMKKRELASMLQYEVEKYIPFRMNEVYFDFDVLRENIAARDSKKMEILLVAVKQGEIDEPVEIFRKAGVEIQTIDVPAFAFANLLEFLSTESERTPTGFLDMGTDTSTFGIILRGKPVFIRDISFGGEDILKLLKRKLGLEPDTVLAIQKDESRMTPEYKLAVEQALSGLVNELKLSLGYYLDHIPGAEPLQTLYIAGRGFRFIPDLNYLEAEIKIPTRRPEIFSRIPAASRLDASVLKENEDVLASALGLCLR